MSKTKSSPPAHLSGTDSRGLILNEPVAQFELGSHRNFIYLILDWVTRKAVIVDPQEDVSPPLKALAENGFELTGIVLTHTHFDHTAGVPALVKRFPAIPIWVNEGDLHRLNVQWQPLFRPANEGTKIPVGGLTLEVLHTPGHSPGECCYFLSGNPPSLFTGDTVFIRDCGRTDLDGGSNEEMFRSLRKISRLPAETVILPGHHYAPECASTLGDELVQSPPFRCKSVEELSTLP